MKTMYMIRDGAVEPIEVLGGSVNPEYFDTEEEAKEELIGRFKKAIYLLRQAIEEHKTALEVLGVKNWQG